MLLVVGCAGALALSSQALAAGTIRVDDDRAQCPTAAFTSIQAAVTAATPNTRIEVCPGLYQEQVTVPAGKNNIDLVSQRRLQAVIKAPPLLLAEPGDIVHVDGARNVVVRDFKITGPLPDTAFCSLELRAGVKVDGGGSAAILRNHITEIRSTTAALRGCQNGIGIAVGDALGSPGEAAVIGNRVDLYQKGGILVDGAGSQALVDSNTVTDPGATEITAPNGIQVSDAADALVTRNAVSRNVYDLAPASSGTGILLFAPGDVTVERNTVFANDDGIALVDTQGAKIKHNVSRDNRVYDGLYANSGSTNNLFEGNVALGNAEHDCHDESVGGRTAGTANTWKDNRGETENRPGLCDGKNDDDDDDDDDDDGDDD